ncbi:helix-turn-helix transcriptional regulator [Xenorhabdus bovienii]|uniref:helix-turn-helix transcriptional regulator n=1 Tax=Xenorhabdus bovienii TaxID=40576 RepID=UPI000170A7A8|nr:PAS and helix-turn-helix domain-containing protein [Xenorhabdus bovienii]CDG88757.1 putative transcriptional regulator [Xenorhabdus bovienii str. feltiae France]CDG93369.1 putative transcriptional regulator [Xenorhabdus bovienii str. feltiae Florida]
MICSTEKIISALINFWEISNEPWGAKDNNSKFIYANNKYNELLSLPKGYDVGGYYDGELPSTTSDFQDEFQKHDRKVESLLDRVTSIEIHPFKGLDYLQPWYFDKFPLIDESGECRGTIFHGRPVDTITLEKLKKINIQTSLIFTPPSEIFSKREWEIIFYIMQGYSTKDIAERLFVSHRTVSNHIQNVYQKTETNCRKSLVDYCYEHNIANYVPENFFREPKSIHFNE